nr:PDZ domain-containing protein [uncultured Dethiosulfovibrio sp.]
MKKLLFAMLAVMCVTTAVSAASLYTVTINDTNIQAVQDAAIEIMTGKNFSIEEITPYKAVFTKGFGDGFWTVSRLCYVNLAFVERDGNVKVMVSETEKIGAIIRQRSINHLVPLIQQIKSAVDGTPLSQVQNEAVDQLPGSGNEREKALGLVLDDQMGPNGIKIMSVDPGSLAKDSGILALDILSEINGRETTSMTPSAVKTYLANKMAAKSSIMIIVTRGAEKKLFTIDPGE